MTQIRVVILDPHTSEPQVNVAVEARNASTGATIALETTNVHGVATFDIAVAATFHARTQNRPPLYQVVLGDGLNVGPYMWDYLVDKNWAAEVTAGRGTEGQVFTTFHGHTFKVYSTVQGAATDVSALGTGTDTTIFIVTGAYGEDVVFTGPAASTVSIYGSGRDAVTITGQTSGGKTFQNTGVTTKFHLQDLSIIAHTSALAIALS
ncbi:MAG: hypothetical protein IIC90_08615, partial [Chloroflexi bacterium]|nr:hypothetical protein [Chloroflexota bacterium]